MADKNIVKVYIALRKEKIFVGSQTDFNDDLSHLSGQQFWDFMVEPLVAHAKQEFIKEFKKKQGADNAT